MDDLRRQARAGAARGDAVRTEVLLEGELYDLVWYRTSDLLARGFDAVVERPLIAGSMSAVTGAVGLGSRELSSASSGLVRSYALALAGGLAILAVVLLVVR